MEESMQAFYDQFVEKVADARHTTPEKIDQIAQGRVWTGQQARQVGLVDQLGGLQLAVSIAKQRARIPADEEVELVMFPPRRSLYELLTERFEQPSERSSAEAILSLISSRDRAVLRALLTPSRLFRSGEILAHMPYVFLR
jgi:protease-4